MVKNKHTIVENIAISRKNLIELVVIAILLAIGTDLIAGQVITSAILSPTANVIIGVILSLGSILYLVSRLFTKRVESRSYKAFLIYNKKKNEIIPVPRYRFSENIYQFLTGAFTENPALKTLWGKEPLKDFSSSGRVKDKHEPHRSAQLLSEAVEYFVLEMLSIHLTDYFAAESFKRKNLREYRRQDIPEVLLSNRFLELFSRPMEDRPAFVDETFREKGEGTGEVVAVYVGGGTIYNRFNLILPKKSIIRRPEDNKVEIETRNLKMSITVRFEGFNTVLPTGFEQYYLGVDSGQDTTEYQVNVDIGILLKLRALFSGAGWEYYRWVDSFLNKIEDEISQETFFNRINWEATFTMLQCLNSTQTKEVRRIKK